MDPLNNFNRNPDDVISQLIHTFQGCLEGIVNSGYGDLQIECKTLSKGQLVVFIKSGSWYRYVLRKAEIDVLRRLYLR